MNSQSIENLAISKAELAQLESQFVLPVVVKDILAGREVLDEEAEFAIADMLSELDSETKVLSLALCVLQIEQQNDVVDLCSPLSVAAAKIVSEYGAAYINKQYQLQELMFTDAPNELYQEILNSSISGDFLAEDLETLADFMDVAMIGREEDFSEDAILLSLLGDQAHLHKDELESAMVDGQNISLSYNDRALGLERDRGAQPTQPDGYEADNVVAFPGMALKIA